MLGMLKIDAKRPDGVLRCRRMAWYSFAIRLGIRRTLRLLLRQPYRCVTCQRVIDLRAMTLVTAAMSPEAFAPRSTRVARVVGAILVGLGLFLIARAVELA
jgi:hypothetical protein